MRFNLPKYRIYSVIALIIFIILICAYSLIYNKIHYEKSINDNVSSEILDSEVFQGGISRDDLVNKYGARVSFEKGKDKCAKGEIFSMTTYMTVTCYGDDAENAVYDALSEIVRIEKLFSIGDNNSEISKLNGSKKMEVSRETAEIIKYSVDIGKATDGVFDITILPLMQLWGFTNNELNVPDDAEIEKVLKLVDYNNIEIKDSYYSEESSNEITLANNCSIDLGGIAKGYTSSRIMEIFSSHNISSGIVSLGGNIQCYGNKPDGRAWKIGVRSPKEAEDSEPYIGMLEVVDKAVITSGGYERFFVDDATGIKYHHILSPDKGYPAVTDIESATIVAKDGALADALSTACFIMGIENASEFYKNSGYEFEMILLGEDNYLYVTKGISENFISDAHPVKLIE